MSEHSAHGGGLAPSRALAFEPPPAALAAVQEIKLLQGLVNQVAQFVEARMMECLWQVKQVIPDEEDFAAFIGAHLDMAPATAWQYAVTWDTARENRGLRSLAQTAPDDALRLVRETAEAGHDDEIDTRVTQVLSLPARRRHEALKELIDNQAQAKAGHNPADREAIRALTAERDELLAERGPARLAPLTRRAREITGQVTDLIAQAKAVEHDVRFLHAQQVEEMTPSVRIEMGYLLPQLDALGEVVEDISGRCQQLIGPEDTHE